MGVLPLSILVHRVCAVPSEARGVGSHQTGVTDMAGRDVDAGNQKPVTWKSSR